MDQLSALDYSMRLRRQMDIMGGVELGRQDAEREAQHAVGHTGLDIGVERRQRTIDRVGARAPKPVAEDARS